MLPLHSTVITMKSESWLFVLFDAAGISWQNAEIMLVFRNITDRM